MTRRTRGFVAGLATVAMTIVLATAVAAQPPPAGSFQIQVDPASEGECLNAILETGTVQLDDCGQVAEWTLPTEPA